MLNVWIIAILLIGGFFFGQTKAGKALAVLYFLIFVFRLLFSYFDYLPLIQAGNIGALNSFITIWMWELVNYYLPPGVGYMAGNSLSSGNH